MSGLEIAVLIPTYQRPRNLRRVLQSIALQEGVDGRMEVVVCDDGSTDDTPRIVADFARTAPFRVGFTTHPHTTFHPARSRNEGVLATTAPYLLFLDGDCIVPRDHVRTYLARRKPKTVLAGDCVRFDEETSERITPEVIASGVYAGWVPKSEVLKLKKSDRRARWYRFIRHARKPRLISNNMGLWRADYERVNGFDENYQGWGCEDDDLNYRLRRVGVRVESILRWTWNYHLWHPRDTTMPDRWHQGKNVEYLLRKGGLARCRNGLKKRGVDDLAIRVVGRPDPASAVSAWVERRFAQAGAAADRPEVEILVLPGAGKFSGQADCNVLVALDRQSAQSALARRAHVVITPQGDSSGTVQIPWAGFEQALAAVA